MRPYLTLLLSDFLFSRVLVFSKKILLILLFKITFAISGFAQCESINASAEWLQYNTGGTANNSYIYDDGTNIRLALKSDNTRLGDNTYPNFNTIVKQSGVNLATHLSQISIINKQGNNTDNFNRWLIGWTANAAFTGVGYNTVVTAANPTPTQLSTQWLANVYIQGNTMYVNTGASGSISVPNYAVAHNDEITAILTPQADGTAALNIRVYRPSAGNNVVNTTFFNAVNAASVSNGPIYPVLNMITGAANVACLAATTQPYTIETFLPSSCETVNASADWPQYNTGSTANNSYIYDDGTNIRLAQKAGNARLGDNTYPNFNTIVNQEGVNLATHLSQINITNKQGNTTDNFNRWLIGWTANSTFPGVGYNSVITSANPTPTQYSTQWLANVYIQGNVIYINTAASGATAVPGYSVAYNDQIIATLLPQLDGTAALELKIYRPSVGNYVVNTTYFNAVNEASVNNGSVYSVLNMITGAANVGCLGASAALYNPALPLELHSFTANEVDNDKVSVKWSVFEDVTGSVFNVFWSVDGTTWATIGRLESTAKNISEQHYSFLHTNPSPGRNYYRMQMRESSGFSTFSPVRQVNLSTIQNSVKVYPNPIQYGERLKVELPDQKEWRIKILNASGAVLREIQSVGASNLWISIDALPAGQYVLHVMSNNTESSHKLLINSH